MRYLFSGVVSGVGDYGNCIGVPNVGGEVVFDRGYEGTVTGHYGLSQQAGLRRDLEEVLTSQNKMIDRLGTEDTTAQDEAMKEAYRNDIVRTRMLCRKRPNFELVEIHYKTAIEDSADAARQVNDFLGGHLDEAAMREAVDASLYRNRAS